MAVRRPRTVKQSRRLGVALTQRATKVLEKQARSGRPAFRGRRAKTFLYKRELLEKQRLRAQYNMSERQMRNYVLRAQAQPTTAEYTVVDRLVQLLERRLDAVVYRGGLAPTIYAARQVVSHGHIAVDGKVVNVRSFLVPVGGAVSVRPQSRDIPLFSQALGTVQAPPYLEVRPDEMSVQFKYLPWRDEVPVVGDVRLALEFYAR